MELIERYLQAIGRHLPLPQRADILAELRAALEDSLEARAAGAPTEADAAAVIRGMGAPESVAASYAPNRQYLIGPELFPLFKLVTGIVLTAVIGAQLLGILLSFVLAGEQMRLVEPLWGLLDSLPAALGFVVLTFYALQVVGVNPRAEPETFDPYRLPALDRDEPVNRFEQIFGMAFSLVFLTLFAGFFRVGGFTWTGGFDWLENPVIDEYFPWLVLSFGLEIVLSIVLLWRGRWQVGTRLAAILSNGFTLFVLSLLIRGHDAWLAEYGLAGAFGGWSENMPELINAGPVAIMVIFRFGLSIAAIIMVIETVVFVYRLVRALMRRGAPGTLAAAAVR